MNKPGKANNRILADGSDAGEKGSAIVISLFVLALISVFVALALSRSSSEAAATGNETAEGRTVYAAQGSLEMMTRNFNKKFEVNIKPTSVEFDDVRNAPVPGLSTSDGGQYTFLQEVLQTSNNTPVVLTGGPFTGLYAKRDNWRLRTTATNNIGVQVQLTRNILNNLVPIFQFGIFYDDDLEFHPGPRFDFGGRVHSNGSLFLQASTGVYFSSKVTTANHVFTDVSKNGSPWTNWNDEIFIKNASNVYVQLQSNMGSVLAAPVNGPAVTNTPTPSIPLPTAYVSTNWDTNKARFDGNLLANTPLLQLPLKLNSDNTNQNLSLNEVIRRGKKVGDLWNNGTGTVAAPTIVPVTAANADDAITASERYYNKTGIRVSLADSRQKLPGCASATDATVPKCGVRLDGDSVGQTSGPAVIGARGYVPRPMIGTPAYQATAVNGERFFVGIANRELWIKVETVVYNPVAENYTTEDITQDILSLGVTEAAPNIASNFVIEDANYNANGYDSRSIIKLQRFLMPGAAVPNTTGAAATAGFISSATWGGNNYNYVRARTISNSPVANRCNNTAVAVNAPFTDDDGGIITAAMGVNFFPGGFPGDTSRAHWKTATITGLTGKYGCVVPFPINVFDTREGLYNDSTSVFDPTAAGNYGSNVPWTGVMSMVDIDVANLKKFLDGAWDSNMPNTTPYVTATTHVLRGNDIPQPTNVAPKSGGWVFYLSDRRGDFDFDGEYDMEDVFGNNDGTLQPGEDINRNLVLQADYLRESAKYTGTVNNNFISPDIAAVFDHKFFRRGVRLINGREIPGFYDTAAPANTRGFTVASENAVYVKGNYNTTGIVSVGTPTPSTDYLPLSTTSADIPASVASDAVIIMSNAWQDASSFTSPFSLAGRTASETNVRFAMLAGDTLTSLNATPNQGGSDPRMNGGVHNFKRFLEHWGGTRLNYSGSLINLFNSRNNNGTFKCCDKVYSPPVRNWVFDASFLDINRLPPGTPYFQYAQTTGFQRTND